MGLGIQNVVGPVYDDLLDFQAVFFRDHLSPGFEFQKLLPFAAGSFGEDHDDASLFDPFF